MRFQVFKSIVQHRTHTRTYTTPFLAAVSPARIDSIFTQHTYRERVFIRAKYEGVFDGIRLSPFSCAPSLHCATTLTAGLHWIAAISHDTNAACNSFTGHGNLNRRSVSPTHSRYQEQPDTFPCLVSRKPFTHSRTLLSSTSRHHFTNDTC